MATKKRASIAREKAAAKPKKVEWGFEVSITGNVMASTREEAEKAIDCAINDAALRARGIKTIRSDTSIYIPYRTRALRKR